MPVSQHTEYSSLSTELISALEHTISPARLGPYLMEAGHHKERALKLYLWNVMLGQSFHFPLQTLEVALRNSLAGVFKTNFGEKWWRESAATRFLDQWALEELATARKRLSKRGVKPNTDDIVGRMSFGFWAASLAPRYKPVLWSQHLRVAFPHVPNGITQDHIYALLNKSTDLRNKIFHHEPLIGLNLTAHYSEIMTLLKWLCPHTQRWVKKHCSVPMILRVKP